MGRPGVLWLQRPEGWADELAGLVDEEAEAEAEAQATRAERGARRRLELAEQAARSRTAELAGLRAELTDLRAELASEREGRRLVDEARSELDERNKALTAALDASERALADLRRRVEADDAERGAELATLRAEDGRLRAALVEAEQHLAAVREHEVAGAGVEGVVEGGPTPTATEAGAPPDSEALLDRAPVVGDVSEAQTSLDQVPTLRPDVPLGQALDDAAAAVRQLAAAAQRLAGALADAAGAAAPATSRLARAADGLPPRAGQEPTTPTEAPSPARRRRSVRSPRRVPLALPGGVFAHSTEAAVHLLRRAGVLLLVDGYNVAKLGWPELTLPQQRDRLLDALDELAARHGVEVRVVFDGADVGRHVVGRRYLQVEFSPPGVSADEVIVRLAESLPVERPVVVATNDGEVRDGARAAGANVIASEQLLAAARR